MEDVKAFLILHSQFLLTIPFFIKRGWGKPLTKYILIFLLLTYSITVLAWVVNLGDDFGFLQYFGMFIFAPAVGYYCMHYEDEFDAGKLIISFILLVPIYAFVGVFTLYLALMATGLEWH